MTGDQGEEKTNAITPHSEEEHFTQALPIYDEVKRALGYFFRKSGVLFIQEGGCAPWIARSEETLSSLDLFIGIVALMLSRKREEIDDIFSVREERNRRVIVNDEDLWISDRGESNDEGE